MINMFWPSILAMLLLAIGILVMPLLKIRKSRAIAYSESNLLLHKGKLKELNADLAEGRIDQQDYKVAKEELDRELLSDIPVESTATAALHYSTDAERRPALALVVAVFLPTLALLIYMQLGMQASSDQMEAGAQSESKISVEDMAAKLEQRVQANGGDVKEWTMLGRTYKYLGRYHEADNALTEAMKLSGPDAQLYLERAEVLALTNEKVFTEEAKSLIFQALQLEPANANALWFAGVSEYQFANYQKSIDYMSKLSALPGGDEQMQRAIRLYVEDAREKLVAAGEKMPAIDELLPAARVEQPATGDAAVQLQVQVDVSDNVREKFSANDVVFVYAKAKQGPKMPLAVQKLTLAQLPASVKLDDSMAMVEGMTLSAFESVVVSARVSRSGSAITQSGDYTGQTDVDNVFAAKTLRVTIDTYVP